MIRGLLKWAAVAGIARYAFIKYKEKAAAKTSES
ncbi:hypothetical protein BH09BAC1_BH09BAC1_00470 [soil metagenome]